MCIKRQYLNEGLRARCGQQVTYSPLDNMCCGWLQAGPVIKTKPFSKLYDGWILFFSNLKSLGHKWKQHQRYLSFELFKRNVNVKSWQKSAEVSKNGWGKVSKYEIGFLGYCFFVLWSPLIIWENFFGRTFFSELKEFVENRSTKKSCGWLIFKRCENE